MSNNQYAANLAKGMCGQCGKVPPREGKKSCQACVDKIGALQKKKDLELKAAGLCVECGENKISAESSIRCKECLEQQRIKYTVKADEKRLAYFCQLCQTYGHFEHDHKKLGLCGKCSNKRGPKKGMCGEHYRTYLDSENATYHLHNMIGQCRLRTCKRKAKKPFGVCKKHLEMQRNWPSANKDNKEINDGPQEAQSI